MNIPNSVRAHIQREFDADVNLLEASLLDLRKIASTSPRFAHAKALAELIEEQLLRLYSLASRIHPQIGNAVLEHINQLGLEPGTEAA